MKQKRMMALWPSVGPRRHYDGGLNLGEYIEKIPVFHHKPLTTNAYQGIEKTGILTIVTILTILFYTIAAR